MDFENFICRKSGSKLKRAGTLLLGDLGEFFEIRDDIPRFVSSENYAEAFGLQWNTFKRTQFDSYTGKPISESRLEAAFGVPLSSLKGKRVLEAGSGAGRFTEVLLKHGALVYSFDFSNAVDANRDNNMPHDNLTIFQADVGCIPFQNDFFDAVVCLGVLQHTPNTKESVAELHRTLKPGGMLVCDHYRYQFGQFSSLYLVYWALIKAFKPETQMRITDRLTEIFFPIHWRFKDNNFIQILLRRVSPINFYYGRYDLPKNIQYEWSRLDTHDRNTDQFKRHVTKNQFERTFRDLGFEDFHVRRGGTGLVCRAKK